MVLKYAAAFIILAAPAAADSIVTWPRNQPIGNGVAYVELHEPKADGAIASLSFQNREIHAGDDAFQLEWNGLAVEVIMEFNVDGTTIERLIITPPEGVVAVPRTLPVEENTTEMAHFYQAGVGS